MPGDLVYSVHRGAILAVPIARTGRASVAHHEVVRAGLANGRAIDISPGHPTPDGRSFADLRSGDWLGTKRVESVRRVPYARPYTVDILPDSDTRTYFASGALVASTLR